jgi:L,D-peptidoglycan transpeptidase YkuD (ErfK/YbiS/YcfS/YnhG family)
MASLSVGKVRPRLIHFIRVGRCSASGKTHEARLHIGHSTIRATLGRSGVSFLKREGDGATPAGRFRIMHGFFRSDRHTRFPSQLPLLVMRATDGWCDDPTSALYNRQVPVGHRSHHESLWRSDEIYDVVLTTSHNLRPRVCGAGSAIFFHLARKDYSATQGCIAIAPADMRRLLPRLAKNTVIEIRR